MLSTLLKKKKKKGALVPHAKNATTGLKGMYLERGNFREVKGGQKGCSGGAVILGSYGCCYNR